MSAPQQLRVLLPESLAKAGWDVLKSRRDVEGILFDDEAPPASLHPTLRSVDGVALGHTDLAGKTVLIIGFGRIGARTASRCLAMDMRVLVYDAMLPSETIRAAGCEPASDMASGIAQADFVCILCPKTTETTNLFDAERLATMKRTAFLINTARGGMVDEAALYQALSSGKLAGAALDVFDTEPLPPDSPLLKLPNFLAAPHVSGLTLEAAARMAEVNVSNILGVLDGKPNSELMLNREALRSAAPPALATGSQ